MLPISPTAAATLLVPEDYATIQEAVDAAVSADVVSIAPGTYRESVYLGANAAGVIIESRGQAATTATTIITGENADLTTHRAWAIYCSEWTSASTEIRYLTITGTHDYYGPAGGIVVDSGSDVTIRDNIITGNSNGGMYGETAGGICCRSGSSATIRNNAITENWGYWGGGAVYCGVNSTVMIEDNVLNLNDSRYDGGAVSCDEGAQVTIQRNEIVGNGNFEYSAGGIYTDAAMCNILGNYIAENVTGTGGGTGGWMQRGAGISVERGNAFIANNIIANNTVDVTNPGPGGGIYVNGFIWTPSATIINNTIHGNSAGSGDAIYVGDRVGTVVVRNNIATSNGDGCAFGSAVPVNSDFNCLWGNVCDYEGAWAAGANDIHADPLFVSATPSVPCSFVLQAGSPCIDAGTNAGAPLIDYALNTRPQDGDGDSISVTDMGAFEGSCNTPPVAVDDSATTNEDTPVTISVLANDSDADDDSLTVTGVTDPPSGSAAINAGDTVTYTPDAGYSGSDSFQYTIGDGRGGQATATVTVTVIPSPEFTFIGLLPPINNDGSSVFKLNRTIPVKFQLIAPDGSYVTDAVAKLYIAKLSNDVVGSYEEPESTSAADTGNTFRYDAEANQYIFNLGTKGLSTGTWALQVVVNDMVAKEVWISLQ